MSAPRNRPRPRRFRWRTAGRARDRSRRTPDRDAPAFNAAFPSVTRVLRLAVVRLQNLAGFEVDDIRKRLDRYVEDAREDAQLVEGGITDALFVARKLRVVDLAARDFSLAPRRGATSSRSRRVSAGDSFPDERFPLGRSLRELPWTSPLRLIRRAVAPTVPIRVYSPETATPLSF